MNKALFLKEHCDLIPCKSLEIEMFLRSDNTKKNLAKRKVFLNHSMSSTDPVVSQQKLSTRCSSQSCLSDVESVEVKLSELFGGNPKDQCSLEEDKKDRNTDTIDKDDLTMCLEDWEMSREGQNHSSCKWGNTYPVSNSEAVNCFNIADRKNSQSQDIFTCQNDTSLEETNTQGMWDGLYTTLNRQPNEKLLNQSICIKTIALPSNKDNNEKEVEHTSQRPLNNETQLSDQNMDNTFSDKELLDYFCYHSFELIDFRDNKVWEKFALKKGLNKQACEFYKQHFLNHIVKHALYYQIPQYFSNYLKNLFSDTTSNYAYESRGSSGVSNENSPKKVSSKNAKGKNNNLRKRACIQSDDSNSSTFENDENENNSGITLHKKSKMKSSNCSPDLCNRQKEAGSSKLKLVSEQKLSKKRTMSKVDSSSEELLSECMNKLNDNPFRKFNMKTPEKTRKQLPTKWSNRSPSDSECDSSSDSEQSDEEPVQTKSNVSPIIKHSSSSDTDDVFSPLKHGSSSRSKVRPGTSSKPAVENGHSTPLRHSFRSSNTSFRSPSTPKPKFSLKFSQKKGLYLHHEKQEMLRYLESNSSQLHSIKGNVFWQNMEAEGVLPGRSWQSLKNHFFRYLMNDLAMYSLNSSFEAKLKRYSQRNSRL